MSEDIKKVAQLLLYLFLIICLLNDHVPDGNIWAIYIKDGHLLVGDFWAAATIVYLLTRIRSLICRRGARHE